MSLIKIPETTTTQKILVGAMIGLLLAFPNVVFQLYDVIIDTEKFDLLEKKIDYALDRLETCNMPEEKISNAKTLFLDSKDILIVYGDYDKSIDIYAEANKEFTNCLSKLYFKSEIVPDVTGTVNITNYENQTTIIHISANDGSLNDKINIWTIALAVLSVLLSIMAVIYYVLEKKRTIYEYTKVVKNVHEMMENTHENDLPKE